jgi:hypothetical protein
LSNIEFMETLSKNEKFAKLTGGWDESYI